MRTVTDGTITQALIDTQLDRSKTPYISIYINSVQYWGRLLYLEHHEESYRDRAIIGLSNRDGSLDDLDLDGEEFEIGYGYDSSSHGGSATDKVDTATLWVKSHQVISLGGERIYQIYAEGMWMKAREQRMIAGVNQWKASAPVIEDQQVPPTSPNGHIYKCTVAGTTGASEPTWPTGTGETVVDGTVTWTEDGFTGNVLYSNVFPGTHTVEELMEIIITSFGWTWTAIIAATSDSIIDVFKPIFEVNQMPYENAAELLYRLVWMTNCYFRTKPNTTWEIVYPQLTDDPDEVYYSYKVPQFKSYVDKTILLIPNSIVVLCNQDPNGLWNTESYPIIFGTASDTDQIAKYEEVVQVFIAGNIRTQADADARAAAILTRLKSEILAGKLVIPHDCRVELHDKVEIIDTRSYA